MYDIERKVQCIYILSVCMYMLVTSRGVALSSCSFDRLMAAVSSWACGQWPLPCEDNSLLVDRFDIYLFHGMYPFLVCVYSSTRVDLYLCLP